MATPEIVGEPMLVTGTTAYGLGFDFYIPSGLTNTLLWVFCGFRYTGTGSSGVQIRVDGQYASLSGSSGTGTPDTQRFNTQQFANLGAGIRRVHVEPTSVPGYIESVVMCAGLLRNAGTATLNTISSNPVGSGATLATQHEIAVYWSYGSSSISSGSAQSLLSVDVLPDSLGSLEIVARKSATLFPYYGFNVSGEVSKLGALIAVPYAA